MVEITAENLVQDYEYEVQHSGRYSSRTKSWWHGYIAALLEVGILTEDDREYLDSVGVTGEIITV